MSSLSLVTDEDEDDDEVEDEGVEEEEVPELEGVGRVVEVTVEVVDVGDWTAEGVEGERSGGAAPEKCKHEHAYKRIHLQMHKTHTHIFLPLSSWKSSDIITVVI